MRPSDPIRHLFVLALCAATGASVAQSSAPAGSARASASLQPTQAPGAQGISGEVTFVQRGRRLAVEGTVSGLKPNAEHGFHVHENGDCSGDGTAAGEHFNPDGHQHANPRQKRRHAGDLYNLKADASGVARVRQSVDTVSLATGATGIVGKSVIVHSKADDYKTQPSGDSGDRLACGVIR